MLAALAEGPAGVMSGVSNAIPHEMVAVHRALLAGDRKAAARSGRGSTPLVDSIMSAPLVQAVKVATKTRGLAVGDPPEPVTALDSQTADRTTKLGEAMGAGHTCKAASP
jgi:dihydrodipicolinate synthase/N-acetylneuraminate lyase